MMRGKSTLWTLLSLCLSLVSLVSISSCLCLYLYFCVSMAPAISFALSLTLSLPSPSFWNEVRWDQMRSDVKCMLFLLSCKFDGIKNGVAGNCWKKRKRLTENKGHWNWECSPFALAHYHFYFLCACARTHTLRVWIEVCRRCWGSVSG